ADGARRHSRARRRRDRAVRLSVRALELGAQRLELAIELVEHRQVGALAAHQLERRAVVRDLARLRLLLRAPHTARVGELVGDEDRRGLAACGTGAPAVLALALGVARDRLVLAERRHERSDVRPEARRDLM